jgi:hypothetical protein
LLALQVFFAPFLPARITESCQSRINAFANGVDDLLSRYASRNVASCIRSVYALGSLALSIYLAMWSIRVLVGQVREVRGSSVS